jgi:ferric enterobactin receptor
MIKLWFLILFLLLSFYGKAQKVASDSLTKTKSSTTNISEVIIQSILRKMKLNDGNLALSVAGNKDFKTSAHLLDVLRKTLGSGSRNFCGRKNYTCYSY